MKNKAKVFKKRLKKLQRARLELAPKKVIHNVKNITLNNTHSEDDPDPFSTYDKKVNDEPILPYLPEVDPAELDLQDEVEDEYNSIPSPLNVEWYLGDPTPYTPDFIKYGSIHPFDPVSPHDATEIKSLIPEWDKAHPGSFVAVLPVDDSSVESYLDYNGNFPGGVVQERSQFIAGAIDINGHFLLVEETPVLYLLLDYYDLNCKGLEYLSLLAYGQLYFTEDTTKLSICIIGDQARYIWNLVKGLLQNELLFLEGYNIALECFPYNESIASIKWPYRAYNYKDELIYIDLLIYHPLGIVWLALQSQLINNFIITPDGNDVLIHKINNLLYLLPQPFSPVAYINICTGYIYNFDGGLPPVFEADLINTINILNHFPLSVKIAHFRLVSKDI